MVHHQGEAKIELIVSYSNEQHHFTGPDRYADTVFGRINVGSSWPEQAYARNPAINNLYACAVR